MAFIQYFDFSKQIQVIPLLQGAARSAGVVHLVLAPEVVKARVSKASRAYGIRDALVVCFTHCQWLLHRVQKSDAHLEAIDAQLHHRPDGSCSLTFNLAKLLCLPCKAISQELLAVKQLLAWLADTMTSMPQRWVIVKLTGKQDRRKQVYGDTRADVWERKLTGGYDISEAESAKIEDAFRSQVQADPVLGHLVQEVANSLDDSGPSSWMTLDEHGLFPDYRGPHACYLGGPVARHQDELEQEELELA